MSVVVLVFQVGDEKAVTNPIFQSHRASRAKVKVVQSSPILTSSDGKTTLNEQDTCPFWDLEFWSICIGHLVLFWIRTPTLSIAVVEKRRHLGWTYVNIWLFPELFSLFFAASRPFQYCSIIDKYYVIVKRNVPHCLLHDQWEVSLQVPP